MGRRPIGKRTLTGAERQKRYRDKWRSHFARTAVLQARLLRAVDQLLKAEGSAQQQAALDKVRSIRAAMLKAKRS